ncbi:MAG: hypothetical protein LQ345_001079 [Seirophora villosa]|nr:MAG: hypothetical protein LQ345_001079 [Seirophora villosa]
MLPLGLLNAAQGHPMLVELKNGETLNGHLIKYLRVPDEIIDLVKDQQQNQPSSRGRGGGPQRGGTDRGRGPAGRGGGRGRGRGRGG